MDTELEQLREQNAALAAANAELANRLAVHEVNHEINLRAEGIERARQTRINTLPMPAIGGLPSAPK